MHETKSYKFWLLNPKKKKKRNCFCEARTHDDVISTLAISIPKKRSCLCEARPHDLHVTARHSTTQKLPRTYQRGQKQTSFNIAQTDILRHDYVRLAQALPRNVSVTVITSLYWSIHILMCYQPLFYFLGNHLTGVHLPTRPQWQHTNCLNQVW